MQNNVNKAAAIIHQAAARLEQERVTTAKRYVQLLTINSESPEELEELVQCAGRLGKTEDASRMLFARAMTALTLALSTASPS